EAAGEDSDLEALINFQGVGQGLNVRLQMAAYIGLILSSPMIIAQIWLFVMPGLHRNERKYAIGFFGSAIPLFFLGCVAGYWAVNQLVPVLMSFTPTEGSTSQIIPYDQYLALLIKTMLAFGIAFVVPVVMVLLNFMGLVSGRTMLKGWRWIIFLSFAFTAVMVPTPEPITLIAMSAAIASLFFGAIVIALIHDRRTARRTATATSRTTRPAASTTGWRRSTDRRVWTTPTRTGGEQAPRGPARESHRGAGDRAPPRPSGGTSVAPGRYLRRRRLRPLRRRRPGPCGGGPGLADRPGGGGRGRYRHARRRGGRRQPGAPGHRPGRQRQRLRPLPRTRRQRPRGLDTCAAARPVPPGRDG